MSVFYSDPFAATPRYNSSILTDMLMEQHLQFLYGKIAQHPSIVDAIVLCKTWIRQRHFDEVCKKLLQQKKTIGLSQPSQQHKGYLFSRGLRRQSKKGFLLNLLFFCTIAYARSLTQWRIQGKTK